MKRMVQYSQEENVEDARRMGRMFLAIARCPKPVIARVHGAALGGGAGLVAACDIGIAVESAQMHVELPPGLSFWADGAELPQRSLDWEQPLKMGDNVIPIAVRGARPGEYRVLALVRA